MNKKEIKYLDPESNNNNRRDNYLNYSSIILSDELKAIQRSIALLRQDIRKIVREEFTSTSLNRGIQG